MSTSVLIVVKIPTAEQQLVDHQENGKVEKLKFTPLCDRLKTALQEINVNDAVWQLNESKKSWRVSFTCSINSTDSVLQLLAWQSIGSYKDTYIGILPYSFILKDEHYLELAIDEQLAKGRKWGHVNDAYEAYDGDDESKVSKNGALSSGLDFKNLQNKFLKSITARLTVAEVASSIKSNAELTFDFLIYAIMASWIAAMGLITDSTVNLVASMLVSPLMSPVLAVTFGTMVRARDIRNLGLRNAAIGFLIPIVFGYIFGFIAFLYLTGDPEKIVPTHEMRERGDLRNLIIGTLVALPSGAAVSLSILSGAQASIIGVAISASLLPPCVNAGLLWSHATIHLINSLSQDKVPTNITGEVVLIEPCLALPAKYKPLHHPHNIAFECLALGLVSFGLTAVNILSIFFAGLLFLKIKEITPMGNLSSATSRFFREDVKIAREHNSSVRRKSALGDNDLGEQIVREWADVTGLDANRLLAEDAHEAKMIQLHTLQDIMEDANSDGLLRTLRRESHSVSPVSPDIQSRARRIFFPTDRSPSIVSNAGSVFRKKPTVSFSPSFAATASTASIDMAEKGDDLLLKDLRQRRRSSNALLKQLSTSDHLPYSMWPKIQGDPHRSGSDSPMTPFVADEAKYRRISVFALASYENEMKRDSSSSAGADAEGGQKSSF